jgi:PAS domain S-box-containing protein
MRLIFDLVPSYIFVKNKEGRFLEVNKALAETLGLPPDEIIGSLQQDIQPGRSHVKKMLQDDQEIFSSGKPFHSSQEILIDRKGNIRWIQTTKIPCPLEIYGEEAIICVAMDITKQKETEEELRTSQENLRNTLQSISDGVIVCDSIGRVKSINDAAEKLTGLPSDQIRETLLSDFIHFVEPFADGTEIIPLVRVKEMNGPFRFIDGTVLSVRDSGKLPVKGSLSPIRGDDNTINGVVILFRRANEAPQISDEESGDSTIGLAQKSVLVVDDEPILRKMLTEILKREGYKVTVAENGKNGLFLFKKHPDQYSLIIMDMVMPEMTGAECYDAIRSLNPEMKILFISGYFKAQNMMAVNESEFTGFIHKPFKRDEILGKIREMLITD